MKFTTSTFVAICAASALSATSVTAAAAAQQAGVTASVAHPVATSAGRPTDKAIDERIEKRLKAAAALKKYDIDVLVDTGVVMLKGTVATQAQKTQVGRLANVTGVSKVDNQIAIDPNVRPSTATRVVTTGAEKTKEGAAVAVDKTKAALSKTGEVINDAWITTKVKTTFVGEDLLKGSDINADTNDRVVTLKGTVTSAAGRTKAVALTQKVEGVTRVIDRLTIGPKQ